MRYIGISTDRPTSYIYILQKGGIFCNNKPGQAIIYYYTDKQQKSKENGLLKKFRFYKKIAFMLSAFAGINMERYV